MLAVIAVAAIVARIGGSEPTAAEELRARLDRAEQPTRFSLRYRRGGTQVLGCMLPNTRFRVDVDATAPTMVVRSDDDRILAVTDRAQVLLDRALFRDPPFTSPWLAVRRVGDSSSAATVRRVLGVDLSAYLLSPRPPATGTATVSAALDAAATVDRIESLDLDGERADGYRLRIDADRFVAAAPVPSGTAPERGAAPLIDVWATRAGSVIRIAIRPQDARGVTRPAEDGWIADYSQASGTELSEPAADEITGIDQVDQTLLAPAVVDCELGG